MHHAPKFRMWSGGIEIAYETRRRGAENPDQRLNRVQHARDAAERQGGGAEPDDLLIRRSGIAPDDLDRIRGGILAVVILIKPLQA